MKVVCRILIVILLLVLTGASAAAQKNLKRRGINPELATVPRPAPPRPDTIVPFPGDIVATGFDKPLRATREAVFVTNNLPCSISALRVELDYTAADGRQLHRRTLSIPCDIPPGQTRRLEFPAWDRTGQFHYRLTPPPRGVAMATPFDVKINIISATPVPNEDSNNCSNGQGTCPAAPYDEQPRHSDAK